MNGRKARQQRRSRARSAARPVPAGSEDLARRSFEAGAVCGVSFALELLQGMANQYEVGGFTAARIAVLKAARALGGGVPTAARRGAFELFTRGG